MAGSDDASKRVVYTRSAPPLEAWLDLEGGGGAVGVLEAAMRKSVADHLAAEVAGAASAVGRRKVREGKGDEDARSPSGTPARASQGVVQRNKRGDKGEAGAGAAKGSGGSRGVTAPRAGTVKARNSARRRNGGDLAGARETGREQEAGDSDGWDEDLPQAKRQVLLPSPPSRPLPPVSSACLGVCGTGPEAIRWSENCNETVATVLCVTRMDGRVQKDNFWERLGAAQRRRGASSPVARQPTAAVEAADESEDESEDEWTTVGSRR